MTNQTESLAPRIVICERCGASFSCSLSDECWCAAEPVRLPLPGTETTTNSAKDCLCRECMRKEALSRDAASSQ